MSGEQDSQDRMNDALAKLYSDWDEALAVMLDVTQPYKKRLEALRWTDAVLGETTPPDDLEEVCNETREALGW